VVRVVLKRVQWGRVGCSMELGWVELSWGQTLVEAGAGLGRG